MNESLIIKFLRKVVNLIFQSLILFYASRDILMTLNLKWIKSPIILFLIKK